jgi:hypothetical protein
VLGEVETLGIHELHFLPMGLLAHAGSALNLPSNFNRYMMLSTDMHVASNSAQAFVYTLPGLSKSLVQGHGSGEPEMREPTAQTQRNAPRL